MRSSALCPPSFAEPVARMSATRERGSAPSSSRSSAATPHGGCPAISRRSSCWIRRRARCRRCWTDATSPRRGRRPCRRCRRGCSRGRPSKSLAIIGSGVQARSHLEALSRVHTLRQVTVWSPNKLHRDAFVEEAKTAWSRHHPAPIPAPIPAPTITAVDHAGEAVVGADIIVLVTSSPVPVLEDGWVKPGAHVISVGACRPSQREMDPALVARARLFVDSRGAALVESGDVVLGIQEGRFGAGSHRRRARASWLPERPGGEATPRSRSSSRWVWPWRT